MDLDRVDVVLVRPSRPANVAASCRAMKNMGIRSLRLVGLRVEQVDADARSLAYGAWDLLDRARTFNDLPAATADATVVVGTSGRADAAAWMPWELAASASQRMGSGRLALVFGPEASGLGPDELALCHARVHIPTHPAQASLNLAQAVLLVSYELFLAGHPEDGGDGRDAPTRASAGELETALLELRECLLEVGYLNRENPRPILAELRLLLARAGPTPREIALLRGVARQVRWAARVAKDRGGSG